MKGLIFIVSIGVALIIVYRAFTVQVDETESGVILQFGQIVKVLDQPGLYFKKPFLQNAVFLDRRLLSTDIKPAPVITVDKQRLTVDSYTLWRIRDPRRFVETMRGLRSNAEQRLDDIVYSLLRDVLGQKSFADILKREFLSDVQKLANKQVTDFGMKIVDVRIKRADLPDTNQQAVYQRMISERQQIAEKYRAEGMQEAQRIRAETDRKVKITIAKAEKEAEELKGQGDAEALKTYADAYKRNPSFFLFWRTLESYKVTLPGTTSLVLSSGADYLRLLEKSPEPTVKARGESRESTPAAPPLFGPQ
jgi:membrane protease subunit HflC